MNSEDIIRILGLEPHPEGGCYRETWRHHKEGQDRGSGTAIYFLLRAGETSRWHRVDATEVWHHYSGAPLRLQVVDAQNRHHAHTLGPNLAAGERPQVVVSPDNWQSAQSLGEWTLVGCTVSPAFSFEGFEMAPFDWSPPLERQEIE